MPVNYFLNHASLERSEIEWIDARLAVLEDA